jgi:hypothetical protein
MLRGKRDGFGARPRFRHDPEIGLGGKEGAHALPNHGMIVHKHHCDRL